MSKVKTIKLALLVGTRPNFVKAMPLVKAAEKFPHIHITLIHSKQHFDEYMSDVFFTEFKLAKTSLKLKSDFPDFEQRISAVADKIRHLQTKKQFDAWLVVGDVDTTLAGALAVVSKTTLVHVEAGLRSFDRDMPEEVNRFVVDQLSHLLFVTETTGLKNLQQEKLSQKQIHYVGNLMIESLIMMMPTIKKSDILKKLNLKKKKYYLVTVHRRENIKDLKRLTMIMKVLSRLAWDYEVIWPVHPGTLVEIEKRDLAKKLSNIRTLAPLGYTDFLKLQLDAKAVITDSGGIQEETSFLGVPCATLRDNTERPITLSKGTNKLFSPSKIDFNSLEAHINKKFKKSRIKFWDNKVSTRILTHLESYFSEK